MVDSYAFLGTNGRTTTPSPLLSRRGARYEGPRDEVRSPANRNVTARRRGGHERAAAYVRPLPYPPRVPALALPDALRAAAAAAVRHARAPYSGAPDAAALLLADGRVVPGVRVESASFSLTIPALLGAAAAARTLAPGGPVVAAALSRPVRAEDTPFAAGAFGPVLAAAADGFVFAADLPAVGDAVSPALDGPAPATPAEGVARAVRLAARAFVPASGFPVGCVGVLPDGRVVGGVNVEHADWGRILCAERTLLATLAAFGLPAPATLYLACLRATCSPCGACRQLLRELAPDAAVWMAAPDGPTRTTPADLLPGAFTADALAR